jgi:hypothetical protein
MNTLESATIRPSGIFLIHLYRVRPVLRLQVVSLEANALGWLDLCEVWLRNGQMGSPDYANTLGVGVLGLFR